jgi:hypothetical protein
MVFTQTAEGLPAYRRPVLARLARPTLSKSSRGYSHVVLTLQVALHQEGGRAWVADSGPYIPLSEVKEWTYIEGATPRTLIL